MKTFAPLLLVGLISACAPASSPSASIEKAAPIGIELGRYQIRISGGDDCRAPSDTRADDGARQSLRLDSPAIALHAPWGAACSGDLRLTAATTSEDARPATPASDDGAPGLLWLITQASRFPKQSTLRPDVRAVRSTRRTAPQSLAPDDGRSTPETGMAAVAPVGR